MKKVKTTSVILICCSILLGSFSCRHEAVSIIDNGNRVIPVPTGEKTANELLCIVSAGHEANGCPGCVLVQGKYMHFDCQGRGNACRVTAAVTLNQIGTDITATTTDTFGLTSEDFFLMPDRSLYYETDVNNNRVFLNIPEQMVYRDAVTRQFTFRGLFFTSAPEYSND